MGDLNCYFLYHLKQTEHPFELLPRFNFWKDYPHKYVNNDFKQ